MTLGSPDKHHLSPLQTFTHSNRRDPYPYLLHNLSNFVMQLFNCAINIIGLKVGQKSNQFHPLLRIVGIK